MKKRTYIFIAIAFAFNVTIKAQTNLVPNPSFEDTVSCPNYSDIAFANGWSRYRGSPEYFNSCATVNFPLLGIPSNYVGYQNAYDGNGYAGILNYDGTSPNGRESIGIQLNQILTIGTKYYVTCYISRADTFPTVCSCNNFGFRFSTNPYSYADPVPIDNFSHVHSNTVVDDSLGWNKISGSFIADSLYKYFMIGNFYDDANTMTSGCASKGAYYYVDKVCVSTDSLACNTVTGIETENKENIFSIYPNPSQNYINIKSLLYSTAFEVIIYDSMGQQTIKEKISDPISQIDISSLPEGIFFLKIINNGSVLNYKLLKQNL